MLTLMTVITIITCTHILWRRSIKANCDFAYRLFHGPIQRQTVTMNLLPYHMGWDPEMMDSGYVEFQNHTYNLHTNSGGRIGAQKQKGRMKQNTRRCFVKICPRFNRKMKNNTGCHTHHVCLSVWSSKRCGNASNPRNGISRQRLFVRAGEYHHEGPSVPIRTGTIPTTQAYFISRLFEQKMKLA